MKKVKIILLFIIAIVSLILFIFWTDSRHINTKNGIKEKELNLVQPSVENTKSKMISPYETVKYVDKKTFSIIKEAYDGIDFYGNFSQGDRSNFDYYRKLFLQLLDGKVEYEAADIEGNYYYHYIDEYGYLSDDYDKHSYSYIFFDIDGDRAPELCITDHASFTYVFDYNKETNKFILWCDSHLQILGTKKYAVTSYPYYCLIELDEYGHEERRVQFAEFEYTDSSSKDRKTCYSVALPYKDASKVSEYLPKSLKEQAFREPEGEVYYFRVTKEQYNDLTKDFFISSDLAWNQIKNVTYTYDELFGNLS